MVNAGTSLRSTSRHRDSRTSTTARLVLSILALNGYATALVSTRRPISITPSLPSTSSLSPTLSSSFDAILSSLTSTADSLSSRTLQSSRISIEGVPGTSITSDEDFKSLQAYLDCTAGNGEWVHDPLGTSLAVQGKGLTVHKMDSKFASCDKRFYKGREPRHSNKVDEAVRDDTDEATEAGGGGGRGGEWDVRESLKYLFKPSPTCSALLPRHLEPLRSLEWIPSRTRFCQLLAHKSLLLLGSTTQYSLHDLLLDFTTLEPHSCYGDLYCKEHALCGGILGSKTRDEAEAVEKWETDERVYHRLPLPPPASSSSHLSPRSRSANDEDVNEDDNDEPRRLSPRQSSPQSLYPSSTYSTLLRYRRTDGLRPFTFQTLPSYQHAFTLLPEKNQQWLADSRRSDLVVFEKPPIPLPLERTTTTTRTGGGGGGSGSEDRYNETFNVWFYDYLKDSSVRDEDKLERVFEAVKQVTESVWIPELFEALKGIRSEPSPADQLVVYRSGWRTHSDCATSSEHDVEEEEEEEEEWDSPGDGNWGPLSRQPNLEQLVYRKDLRGGGKRRFRPLHVVFHNLQIVLQNHLVRTAVLPRFGIPYLDLETPLSIWRSGLLGGSSKGGRGMRSSTSGDCHRYCWPSPGMAIEGAFVGGLARLMEVGWARNGGSEKEWVGDEFRNLRMRLNDRGRA